jgi:hypothetical protein
MRLRAPLLLLAFAIVVSGIGVSGASAATLWTTPAHTTRVPFGSTAVATSEGGITLTSGGFVVDSCLHSSLAMTLMENDMTGVALTVTTSSFSGCAGELGTITGTHGTALWRLTVKGSGTVSGTTTVFASQFDNVVFDAGAGGTYSGTLTTGVQASQPTAGGAPICVTLVNAGPGGGTGITGTMDGKYCFTGGLGATWSLAN